MLPPDLVTALMTPPSAPLNSAAKATRLDLHFLNVFEAVLCLDDPLIMLVVSSAVDRKRVFSPAGAIHLNAAFNISVVEQWCRQRD